MTEGRGPEAADPPLAPDPAIPAEAPSTAGVPPSPAIAGPPGPAIELVSTWRLIGAAFELLGRSSDDMRRASFYVGSVVLGTIGPFILAVWAINVVAFDHTFARAGRHALWVQVQRDWRIVTIPVTVDVAPEPASP